MSVFLKNVAKSLFTNVLPQGAAQVLPNVSEVTSRFKADLDKSEAILYELKSKTSKFSQASNFAGFKKIHKTALKQLTTGNFGLSQEEQGRLFTPFTRLHKVEADGYGIGLSIVERVAARLGESAGVEGASGQGSRFWFTLPRCAIVPRDEEIVPRD